MTVFGDYARYYDLLYKDKAYAAETAFVRGLLDQHATGTQSILELGCGTGGHAEQLARLGYQVHGVDMSDEMLRMAAERHAGLPPDLQERINFSHGDVREFEIPQNFDVVISLFHVMSYQTTNQDLLAAFATARKHLKEGGVFLFDCWYGPAVLTDRPSVRVKRLADDNIEVIRIAEPVMSPGENVVEVGYETIVTNKQTGGVNKITETHRMRYLFQPEIDLMLTQSGFTLVNTCEWLTSKAPGFDTWGLCCTAKTV